MTPEQIRKVGPVDAVPTSDTFKAVDATALNNTTARETPAHNTGDNTPQKDTGTTRFGGLGAKGHGGGV